MKRFDLVLVIILLVATWLRFDNLDAQSFWNDEGNSARLSERSVRLILEGTASDVHPPLYYLILRGYREFVGDSEFALRSVSAFAGVLLVAATAPLTRLTVNFGRRHAKQIGKLTPNIAALIVAANPAMVYYSQEARMYMLLPLLMLLSTVLLLCWQRELLDEEHQINWRKPVGLAALLVAGLYTHYFFPIIFAIHGIFVVALRRRRLLVAWVGVMSVSLAMFALWLPNVVNGLGGNRGEPKPLDEFSNNLIGWMVVGEPFWDLQLNIRTIALLLSVLLIGVFQWQMTWRVWTLFWLPIAALMVVGATDSAFHKFVLFSVVGLAIGIAFLCGRLFEAWKNNAYRIDRHRALGFSMGIVWFMLSGYVLMTLAGFRAMNNDPAYQRADYRGMAARISAENHPNAGIILNAPNQWEVFTYYHQDAAPVYPLPRSYDFAAVQSELETIAATHERLYVLYWGDALQDPEHWVENWLADNAFKASEAWVQDVRFAVYALPQRAELPMNSAEINFGDQIELIESGINKTEFLAGDVIQTAFTWRASQPLASRYKLFIHLLDANGQLVAQNDSEPNPMTIDWQAQAIGTQHGLLIPPDLPEGSYRLTIGWYDVANPADRLPISAEVTTHEVATVQIQR